VVEILAITSTAPDSPPGFKCIARLDTLRQPIAMCGSLLALADDESETIIWNWKTQEYAVLQSPVDADLWRVCHPVNCEPFFIIMIRRINVLRSSLHTRPFLLLELVQFMHLRSRN